MIEFGLTMAAMMRLIAIVRGFLNGRYMYMVETA